MSNSNYNSMSSVLPAVIMFALLISYKNFIEPNESITLEKYTVSDGTLYTYIPKYRAHYEIKIPKTINIKNEDEITIKPDASKTNIFEITSFSINGNPLKKEDYPLQLTEIKKRPYNE